MSKTSYQQDVPIQSDCEPAVRIGLVGCGRLAEVGYVPAFRQAAGVTLVGVADINQSRCYDIAPQVPAFDGIQSMVLACSVDALVIATPTRCHLADARHGAQKHLPALLEKPPGVDLSEAQALLDLAPQPWIAFNRRFDPEIVHMKKGLPSEGKLCLRIELHYRRKSWNPFDMCDDALLDLGPHLIDLARWLTNSSIRSVKGLVLEQGRAEFELELERGNAVIACSSTSPYCEVVQVKLGNGKEVGSFKRGGIVAGVIGKLRPTKENPLVNSLIGQLEAFGQAVRRTTATTSLGTVRDGLVVMSVIEAVRRSAKQCGVTCPVLEPGRVV